MRSEVKTIAIAGAVLALGAALYLQGMQRPERRRYTNLMLLARRALLEDAPVLETTAAARFSGPRRLAVPPDLPLVRTAYVSPRARQGTTALPAPPAARGLPS